jgi:hypothetical protein
MAGVLAGSGVLGKISGVRVIHAPPASEYISAHIGAQIDGLAGCGQEMRRNIATNDFLWREL